MKFITYFISTGALRSIHDNDVFPSLVPSDVDVVEISNAEYIACCKKPENFIIRERKLVALNDQLSFIRLQRDVMLKDSDIYMLADFPITEEKRTEWKTYRQALRDFPALCDPTKPVWPVPPQ